MVSLPFYVMEMIQAGVSCKRIDEFLGSEEIEGLSFADDITLGDSDDVGVCNSLLDWS